MQCSPGRGAVVLLICLVVACTPARVAQEFDASPHDGGRGDAVLADRAGLDLTTGDLASLDIGVVDRSGVDQQVPDSVVRDTSPVPDAATTPDATAASDLSSPADTSAAADSNGSCPAVELPAVLDQGPLPGEAAVGRSETTGVDGFTDEYIYNATGYTKLGVRREWGGTIIFFGLAGDGDPGQNSNNVIDANDTGREVQVAFYDPDRRMQNCAHDAACRTRVSTCPESITYLGWNPVQGGNRCNVGSGVLSASRANGVLDVVTQPLHWNPNWDRTDCSDAACSDSQLRQRRSEVTVRQRARFINPHIVELDYLVDNPSDMSHAATGQEMPTVYTSNGQQGPDLWRLYNSSQTQIAIDQPGNDGFFYKSFDSPGGWVSLQNENLTYGVGMYYENRLTGFQGWQNRGLPFNNFRAQFSFGIAARAQVRARAYLILGSLTTVAAEAAWLDSHLPPFGWLDEPVADQSLRGQVTVRGWALDNKGVTTVQALVDGVQRATLSYGSARADVCKVWPGYAGCNDVGFSGALDTGVLSACPHLLEIVASDGDGNSRVIARQRVVVAH